MLFVLHGENILMKLSPVVHPDKELCVHVLGISTPDGALYESLKLLCSLLLTLVGKGLYGTTTSNSSGSNLTFINQGMFVRHPKSSWCLFCIL